MWLSGVRTCNTNVLAIINVTQIAYNSPSWLAFDKRRFVSCVVCKALSFCRQTSMNWWLPYYGNLLQDGWIRTFPYTRARTPAVSICSSVHARHLPAIVSDHIYNHYEKYDVSKGYIFALKDLRGSKIASILSSSLYGLPAICSKNIINQLCLLSHTASQQTPVNITKLAFAEESDEILATSWQRDA